MANMSYCRFENTADDLDDCVNAIDEMIEAMYDPESEHDQKSLSRSEEEYRRQLREHCERYLRACEAYEDQREFG